MFFNRHDAGQRLAQRLLPYRTEEGIVLALPRGGVAVGYEIAQALHWPLDVFVVRKIGAPKQPELAIGAVAPGNTLILNHELIEAFGLSDALVQSLVEREMDELERRERVFRGDRPFPNLQDKSVILADDGLATGSTAMVALLAIRQMNPKRIILTVPVGSQEAIDSLKDLADTIICLETPTPFWAVGLWYQHFPQATDDEVIYLLDSMAQEAPTGQPGGSF